MCYVKKCWFGIILNKNITISKNSLYIIFIGIILILIAGFRPIGIDGDSLNYASVLGVHLENANFIDKEPTFWLINEFNHIVFNSEVQTFFLIFAIIGVSLKLYAIKILSINPLMSILVYLSLYFILHEMTQIRVGVASAIFLLAIPDIINKNFKIYLLKTIFAMSFHYSAFIMIFIYFLSNKRINQKVYYFLPLLGFVLSILQNIILQIIAMFATLLPAFIGDKVNLYILLLDSGKFSDINIFNFYYISLIVFYYIALMNYKKFNGIYDILNIKILGIMLFLFYSLSVIPVLAFRISEFFGVVLIFLIPNFIRIFKQKSFISIPIIIWLTIYLFFIMILRNLNFQ